LLNDIRSILQNLNNAKNWSLQVLQIKPSKRAGTEYTGREIIFDPAGRLEEFVSEVSELYIGAKGCFDAKFVNLSEYDGSANGKTIYKLNGTSPLIASEYNSLMQALANPNSEVDPFEMKARASVLVGQFERDETIIPIKLISMQNPITMLKHRFMQNKGAFQELDKKVLTLRPTIDVLIYGNEVYLFTLNGENLFNMERSYKVLCSDYIAKVQESEIVVNIEKFSSVAGSGHNPRRFVSYNQSHLEKLKNASTRRKIATKFSIPMDGGKFDTNQEGVTEKIVKILCDKGMVDPFESLPMEVPSAKKWE
jgi:hypothetical protein